MHYPSLVCHIGQPANAQGAGAIIYFLYGNVAPAIVDETVRSFNEINPYRTIIEQDVSPMPAGDLEMQQQYATTAPKPYTMVPPKQPVTVPQQQYATSTVSQLYMTSAPPPQQEYATAIPQQQLQQQYPLSKDTPPTYSTAIAVSRPQPYTGWLQVKVGTFSGYNKVWGVLKGDEFNCYGCAAETADLGFDLKHDFKLRGATVTRVQRDTLSIQFKVSELILQCCLYLYSHIIVFFCGDTVDILGARQVCEH